MKKQTFVSFDVDGTLLKYAKSGPNPSLFIQAMKRTIGETSINQIKNNTNKFVKKDTVDEIVKSHGIEPSKEFFDVFSKNFEKCFFEVKSELKQLPGAEKLLRELSSMENITLGISTGNNELVAWEKLRRVGLSKYFDSKICGFSFTGKKSAIESSLEKALKEKNIKQFSKMVHIGDTIDDAKSAIELGFEAIVVRTGVHMRGFPSHTYVFDSLEDKRIMKIITND